MNYNTSVNAKRSLQCASVLCLLASWSAGPLSQAGDQPIDFFATLTWEPPSVDQVVTELAAWLAAQPMDPTQRDTLLQQWGTELVESSAQSSRLDILASMFVRVTPGVAELVDHCQSARADLTQPTFEWFADDRISPLVRDNMRLYYMRWLVQAQLYDEALTVAEGLRPQDVVDPSALLFYRAVAHHHLAHAGVAEALAVQLLEREWELPERYRQIAGLIQKDNETVQVDSLDHISRRMADIRRRLDKGRAGESVQYVEKGVIESLDKLIEEIEKQQQQISSQGLAGGMPSGSPMQDSQLPNLKAPGKVDHRDIGNRSGWGNLPPKEREQALQQIGREFPAHYREVIEQYFIELANEPSRGDR